MKSHTLLKKSWEERFNKKFTRLNLSTGGREERWFVKETTAKELKDFIHSTLASERKQMEKEIRGMKRKPNSNYATNAIPYNQALQDVIDLLKKETKNICLNCGRELKPDKTTLNFTTKKWDGHTYKCKCMPKLRISIG